MMTQKPTEPWRMQAEELLRNISQTKTVLADIAAKRQAAVDAAARAYDEQAAKWQEDLSGLDAELVSLMTVHKIDMFEWARVVESGQYGQGPASDLINLIHGSLRYGVETPVVKVRNMLETLQALGRNDLIIIIEKPDWDKIEALPDDDLEGLGTARKIKERFAYDVKPFLAEGK